MKFVISYIFMSVTQRKFEVQKMEISFNLSYY